ncbi:hypothetical protein [Enterobacter phage vB_EcRAM-01]|nr:hypothetical protein [Enterobacter phage vB_EcRAM-01]
MFIFVTTGINQIRSFVEYVYVFRAHIPPYSNI